MTQTSAKVGQGNRSTSMRAWKTREAQKKEEKKEISYEVS